MPSRTSGLLVHVSSLPGRFGVGDLGPSAYRFVDFLERAGQGLWQVLPLVPTGLGDSPYASPSTFAGNALFISPERLADDGLLPKEDVAAYPKLPAARVDYDAAMAAKKGILEQAFARFQAGEGDIPQADFARFCDREADWLDDYALFMALREHHGTAGWTEWPRPLARRQPKALAAARREHADALERRRFWQFLFDRQWRALRAYAAERGVRILGDLPIYVAQDSADVWAHPDLFSLDDDGRPTHVAGVPPDYFSDTGQRWGNPLYRWDRLQDHRFDWWVRRLERALELVDVVRLDHFRGFEAYWEIPADEATAVNGRWVEAPGEALFDALRKRFGAPLPLVAEDLGLITEGVRQLKAAFDLPGMVVLQFGLDEGPTSEYLPHNYDRHSVAYTGTHDNDTFVGWLGATKQQARRFTRAYLGVERSRRPVQWEAIRAVMASSADTVVVPLQDVLGLGSEARMNTPGSETGNWTWRFTDDQLSNETAERLRRLAEIYGRTPSTNAPG